MKPYYILENKIPVRCDDVIKWADWFEVADRRLFVDMVKGVKVSTVFLGLDWTFGFGSPQLFKTMIFGGVYNNRQYMYATYAEAEAGHIEVCNFVRAAPGVIQELPTRKIIVLKQNK